VRTPWVRAARRIATAAALLVGAPALGGSPPPPAPQPAHAPATETAMEATLYTASKPRLSVSDTTVTLVDVRDVQVDRDGDVVEVTEVTLQLKPKKGDPVTLRLEIDGEADAGPLHITVIDAGIGREKASDKRAQGFAALRLETRG